MVFNGGDGSVFNPIDVSDLEVISAFKGVGGLFNNKSEVLLDELFLGEVSELVDTLFIGSVFIGVVGIDFGEVLKEDFLSVDVLEFRCELNSELLLEGFELRNLGGGLLVEEDSSSSENCQKEGKILSVH